MKHRHLSEALGPPEVHLKRGTNGTAERVNQNRCPRLTALPSRGRRPAPLKGLHGRGVHGQLIFTVRRIFEPLALAPNRLSDMG